jgi:uncharacterized protein
MENLMPLPFPFHALAGGVLIGSAAVLLLWFNGRIAGISGMTGKLLSVRRGEVLWRVLFLIGLIAGAALYYVCFGNAPQARPNFPSGGLIGAGLLVGFGTSLGSGCTSGHGVCGLGRLSLRSLWATLAFLLVGILTTYVVRHVLGVM